VSADFDGRGSSDSTLLIGKSCAVDRPGRGPHRGVDSLAAISATCLPWNRAPFKLNGRGLAAAVAAPPYLHDGRLLTLEDTVEFFNLVLELKLPPKRSTTWLTSYGSCSAVSSSREADNS